MINGLSINPEVLIPPYRNTFVATIEFMFGDADSYTTRSVELNEDQAISLKNLFDHGKFNRGYHGDPLYRDFRDSIGDEDLLCDIFPNDPDGWGPAKFEALSVVWYDENGYPHAVEFWWQ